MQEIFNVSGMHCQKCVQKIQTFVLEIEGVQKVEVDLEKKIVQASFESPATRGAIKEAILDAGFEVD